MSDKNNAADLVGGVTVESLRDLIQKFGYRAEIIADAKGVTLVRSSTSGVIFDIRLGNRIAGDQSAYADFTFLALFRVQGGELPLTLLNGWNNARRFGRLHFDQGFLMLDMDVSLVGGVHAAHLRAQFEIWDQLLQGLVAYLRSELPRATAATGAEAA
ncbi:MAG TPA: YbjN domain-containing protein [Methylovirgula sp.]|nr:YbjN domain-containing protein [Methylovirgula sp.]